jgi:hypothetical protein
MDRGDLALAAALAEAAGDEDGVERLEGGGDLGVGMLEQFASSQRMLTLTRLARPPWTSASVSDLYASWRPTYLPTTPDRHLPFRVEQSVEHVVPAREIGRRRVVDAEGMEHLPIEAGLVILGGNGIDAGASSAGTTASLRTLQNKAIFSRSLSGSGRSQRQTMISGWMPNEVNSRTLCWVGLVFSSPAAAI